jgi:hypothetical protein
LSIEFRQISGAPLTAVVWWMPGDSNHACTSGAGRFETTPMSFSGIISTSKQHCGHQALSGLRPRRTKSESVSIDILVNFAIALTFASPENLLTGEQDGSLPEWSRKVLSSAMNISDDFSLSR